MMVFAANGTLSRAVAAEMAAGGATVLLSGRDADRVTAVAEELRAAGGSAEVDEVDPTDAEAVRAYVDRVSGEAPIDAAFTGMGVPGPQTGYGTAYDDLDPTQLADGLSTVVRSQFLSAREAARVMAAGGGGSVVTIASTLGRSGRPHTGALSATAGALEGLARSLATEYGHAGVRVNHVRATRVATPEQWPENVLGRAITPAEVGATVAWLCSRAASGVTGQVIEVSGGEVGHEEISAD